MHPYLHIGSFNLPTFGLMLWLAVVAAMVVGDRAFKRAHMAADALGDDGDYRGGRHRGRQNVVLVLDSPAEFKAQGWGALLENAGFSWFGGLVFGILALVLQGWRAKIGGLRTLDFSAPGGAIGHGLGRMGCFLSGDGCYGIAIKPVHLLTSVAVRKGAVIPRSSLLASLIAIQYERNEFELKPGIFRAKGDTIDIVPGYQQEIIRIVLDGDMVSKILLLEPVSASKLDEMEEVRIFPAKHDIVPQSTRGKGAARHQGGTGAEAARAFGPRGAQAEDEDELRPRAHRGAGLLQGDRDPPPGTSTAARRASRPTRSWTSCPTTRL